MERAHNFRVEVESGQVCALVDWKEYMLWENVEIKPTGKSNKQPSGDALQLLLYISFLELIHVLTAL